MKVHRIAACLCLALAACLAPRPQPAGADVLTNGYTTVREGNADNAMLGFSVATAGDVNGDGYSDVLLNGPQGNGMVSGGTLEFTEEWALTGAPTRSPRRSMSRGARSSARGSSRESSSTSSSPPTRAARRRRNRASVDAPITPRSAPMKAERGS
jgi:FG-GAP repeat